MWILFELLDKISGLRVWRPICGRVDSSNIAAAATAGQIVYYSNGSHRHRRVAALRDLTPTTRLGPPEMGTALSHDHHDCQHQHPNRQCREGCVEAPPRANSRESRPLHE